MAVMNGKDTTKKPAEVFIKTPVGGQCCQPVPFRINFSMNYLAHAYFSFQQPAWQVGNLISDFVKGRKQYDYPPDIQKGIRLHRMIDAFTDNHEATKQAKEVFRPHYRLYAGAFVDVVYDYFLANDARHFASPAALYAFSQNTYDTLLHYYDVLPPHFQQMYFRMREQNWLYHYHQKWGIEKSFGGVVYRSRYLEESETAYQLFENNLQLLDACYQQFLPALISHLHGWHAENNL
jgi:acyl carrier protein phosphodiesterase